MRFSQRFLFSSLIIASCVFPAAAPAQTFSRRATIADSTTVSRNSYERLFAGIALDTETESKVRNVLRRAFVEKILLDPIMTQEQWDTMLAIQDRRDSVLVSLVARPDDRIRLQARLKEERPTSFRFKS